MPRAIRIVAALALLPLSGGLGCGSTAKPAPVPSGSASAARGPEVNWRGRDADHVPTAFFEEFAPKVVSYEVETLVNGVLAGTTPSESVFYDGSAVLYTHDWTLSRVASPLAEPVLLHGKKADPLRAARAISPDGRWIVGVNRRGVALLSATADGVTEEPVFASDQPIESPVFTDDGASLFFSEVVTAPSADGAPGAVTTLVHRFDLAKKVSDVVTTLPGRAWLYDASSEALLVKANSLSRVDLATKEVTPIDGAEARFGAVKGELVVLVVKEKESYVERRGANGVVLATSPRFSLALNLDASRRSKRVAVQEVRADGSSTLAALDLTTLGRLDVGPREAVSSALLSMSPDGDAWVLSTSFVDRPPEVALWDWKTRSATRWIEPVRCTLEGTCARVPPSAAPVTSTYDARDGTKQTLHVRTPATCDPGPCVVVVRLADRPSAAWSTYAEIFNQAGYVTVDASVRSAVPTDVQDLAKHVRASVARGRPIGAYGWGVYGSFVLGAMTASPGAFDAGASMSATVVPQVGSAKDPVLLLAEVSGAAPIGDSFQLRRELDRKGVDASLAMIREEWYADFRERGGYAMQILSFFLRVLR